MPKTELLSLPAELILSISENLVTLRDVNSLSRACHRLHAVCTAHLYTAAVEPHPHALPEWQRRREQIFRSVIERNITTALERLLAHDAASTRKRPRGSWTRAQILGAAVTYGTVDAVRAVLAAGVSAATRISTSTTALHLAADKKDHALAGEMVALLLRAGADPDASKAVGDTPLARACRAKNVKVMRALLACGASANASAGAMPRHGRMSALEVTESHECARLLLEHGANATRVALEKWLAAYRGECDVALIRLLVEQGARIRSGDGAAVEAWRGLARDSVAGFHAVENILLSAQPLS